MQYAPGTVGSLLYAAMLGVGGALCGRAHSTQHRGNLIDRILYVILVVLFLTTYAAEWITIPRAYFPGEYCPL